MRLAAPERNLRVSVVVPAKDEEDGVGAALDALADQSEVASSQYEVLLVLDGCSDSTAEVARERSIHHPDLRLHVLEGPDEGVGNARRLGMEVACERLIAVRGDFGLIATTDADSVVGGGWISSQLSLLEAGAEAIGGRIKLSSDGADLPDHVLKWYEDQARERYADVLARHREDTEFPQEHWQFSGASMSLTTRIYREVGGLYPHRSLEDEHLERELYRVGARIVRSTTVRVTTSARTVGRANGGLASNLARASRSH